MLKFTDLWALEKKCQYHQLFSLETLKFHLRLDFLMNIFSKFKSQVLKDFYNLSIAESTVLQRTGPYRTVLDRVLDPTGPYLAVFGCTSTYLDILGLHGQ